MSKPAALLAVLMILTGTALGVSMLTIPTGGSTGNLDLAVGSVTMDGAAVDNLTVTFSKARVFQGDGWTEEILDDTPVNLLDLDGTNGTATIANLTLPEGEYNKLELDIDTVSAQVDGQDVQVFVPGGKVMIVGGFMIEDNDTVTYEFNVRLVKRGNQDVYNLLPVISKRDGRDNDNGKDNGNGGHDDEGGAEGNGLSNKAHVTMALGKAKNDINAFDMLNVTFYKARIYQAFMVNNTTMINWTDVDLDNVTVDLTNLSATNETIVGNLTLGAGNYTEIDLFVSDVVGIVGGDQVEVFVPSGKLKIVGAFNLTDNETASFTFDIDVVQRGHKAVYNLLPVISRMGSDDDDGEDDGNGGHDDDGGADENGSSNGAHVTMALGKAKNDISAFDMLNVTFYKARIYQAFMVNNTTMINWTDVELDNVTVDLTNLSATNETIVGNLTLGAGNYTKIELFVSDVVGIVDGNPVDVFVPSGTLKIVGAFNLTDNETASFTFDIDVVQRGHMSVYNLLPVIAKNQDDEDEVEDE